MNDVEPDTPRGHDTALFQRVVLEKVAFIVKDIELRKWCISQALADTRAPNTMPLAKEIYAFVVNRLDALKAE